MLADLIAPNDDPDAERWARQRRAPRACDQALTGTARRWLRQLPPRRRPLRLCVAHPRVANRIAWCWADMGLSEQVLEDLLVDRRGGRRGFAPAIVRELRRLREYNAQHRREPRSEGLWQTLGRLSGLA
ncbi:MAG: hypothetical protein AMXMBFR66_21310 [Pseudomonadota bacterium]|nr:hypothetical protein [Rubrivivax sp.]